MSGDLLAEKEYKETINGGVKTWQWLKSLFAKKEEKQMSDDEFIGIFLEEAKGKTDEIDKLELENDLENHFSKDFTQTAEMVKESNEKSLENSLNEKSKGIENENIAKVSKEIPNESLENKQENAIQKDLAQDSKVQNLSNDNLSNDSFVKDFSNTFTETQKLSSQAKTLEIETEIDTLKSNAEMRKMLEDEGRYYFNYFTAKQQYREYDKQQGIVQSKQDFMKEFKAYVAKDMSADEMRVLIALSNKKDSKLTAEHKLMIKECLHIAQEKNPNFQFLGNGHKAIIRANNNQKLGTQSIK